MSGVDQVNEGGDYVIKDGKRVKVGYTTDELTQALAMQYEQEPAAIAPLEPADAVKAPAKADTKALAETSATDKKR